MTERSVTHSTFVLERTYDRAPARVFAAWSDPAAKARWFGDAEEGKPAFTEFDFRVGGRESNRSEPGASFQFSYDSTYHEIVADERIVFSYDLVLDNVLVSVSVATVEFRPTGAGTLLTYTEHGAYLDGHDKPELREHGTGEFLDALGVELERETANA
jgi:uncharacterized protein YndB with AHSA1/START domain